MLDEYHGKEIRFNMTTNGTLLNEKYVNYLAENKVLLHISIDGPEEYHNEYRRFANSDRGSFKTIEKNVDYIKKKYPEYYNECISFGITLSPYRNIRTIEDFILNGELIGKENYTRVSRVNRGEELNIYKDKKMKENVINEMVENMFVDVRYLHGRIQKDDIYLGKSKIPFEINDFVEKLDNNRIIRKYSNKILPSGCCIPGTNKLYVSTDGGYYICEKCNEDSDVLKLGDVDNGIDVEKSKQIVKDFYCSTEEECLSCWAYLWCYTCPVQIEKDDSLSREEKLNRCKKVKNSVRNHLTYYLTILEKNPQAFDK